MKAFDVVQQSWYLEGIYIYAYKGMLYELLEK